MAKQETKYPAIPEPTQDVAALLKTMQAIKQSVEILTGQRNANSKGLDSQLTDLRSTFEGREARFTQFTETSTANQEALARRTTTLEAEVETQAAKITSVETAYATADMALASRIDTVEASAGAGFANGSLRFEASAGPAGYYARYDLKLTANDAFSGFSVLAKDDGAGNTLSEIVLTAERFRLQDPALGPTPVFAYMAGAFQFNVPVRLLKNDLAARSASQTFNKRIPSEIVLATGSQNGTVAALTVDFTVDAVSALFVSAYMVTNVQVPTASGGSPVQFQAFFDLYVDGNKFSYQNKVHQNAVAGIVAPTTVQQQQDYLKYLLLDPGPHTVEIRYTFFTNGAGTNLRIVDAFHAVTILDR